MFGRRRGQRQDPIARHDEQDRSRRSLTRKRLTAGKATFVERVFATAIWHGRPIVYGLRIAGTLIVLWYERLIFLRASLRCTASDIVEDKNVAVSVVQITVLADPQLIDRHSYERLARLPFGLHRTAYLIVRWAADTYVRKSFQAVVRTYGRGKSEAVVWLGDLLDGGRATPSLGYEEQARRFRSLCPESVPSVYVPGNHDIRIPITEQTELERETHSSKERWLETWGTWFDEKSGVFAWSKERTSWNGKSVAGKVLVPTLSNAAATEAVATTTSDRWRRTVNARLPFYLDVDHRHRQTHELVLVDALELAGMLPADRVNAFDRSVNLTDLDDVRATRWWREDSRRTRFSETIEFVNGIRDERTHTNAHDEPFPVRIIFSHVPLHRNARLSCSLDDHATPQSHDRSIRVESKGVRREGSGKIDQGMDRFATYQNMIAEPVSRWLLESVRPGLIFSGDNHDHCHVRHSFSSPPMKADGTADELTLKAFSMTGGVRTPGFARLWLTFDPSSSRAGAVAMPCSLPDQVAIWTKAYPTALLLLLCLFSVERSGFLRVFRTFRGTGLARRKRTPDDRGGLLDEIQAEVNVSQSRTAAYPLSEEIQQILLCPVLLWLYLQLF